MGNVISISGAASAPKNEQSRMDTIILTKDMVANWRIPAFQRPLRVNDKVMSVAKTIAQNESIEGVITLGRLRADATYYIVDGQHRIEAFKLSELQEAIADVRVVSFDSMAEMADEFVNLNSNLVKMRPDDILRGLEASTPVLRQIIKSCDFVGYDQIRRGRSSPIVSMSALLRCWAASQFETPSPSSGVVGGAANLARTLDTGSMQHMIQFLNIAQAAWGRDPEYYRLWGNLNLTLCMWLWNRLVIDRDRAGGKRYICLSAAEFKKCLMSVSAEADYVAWLLGLNLGDRDRAPAYGRLKSIFVRRLSDENKGERAKLPSPAWSNGR